MIQAPSLLITDDDQAFRETLQIVFEPLGVETLLAEDGAEALEIVQKREIHLVLLDMHMPRLTGLETLRRVRQSKGPLPCILMSARLDETIVREANEAHADSVLSKPVTRRQLLGVVQQILEKAYHWRADGQ